MIDKVILKKHANTAKRNQIIFPEGIFSGFHQKQKIYQQRQINAETNSGREYGSAMDLGHIQPPQTAFRRQNKLIVPQIPFSCKRQETKNKKILQKWYKKGLTILILWAMIVHASIGKL